MSEVFDRLLCASANGLRAPIDADDVRELVALYEATPGEHPKPEGPFHLNEYLANRAWGGPGGGRVVVRHRPLRRLARHVLHPRRRGRGPRREGQLARRPPAGAPRPVLGALHRMAGPPHRAARRRGLPRGPAPLRVTPGPAGGRRIRVAPFVMPAVPSPAPSGPRGRASRSPLASGAGERRGRPVSGRSAPIDRGGPACPALRSPPFPASPLAGRAP